MLKNKEISLICQASSQICQKKIYLFFNSQASENRQKSVKASEILKIGAHLLQTEVSETHVQSGAVHGPEAVLRGLGGQVAWLALWVALGSVGAAAASAAEDIMAPRFGNTISHAHNTSRRRWNVNLRPVRASVKGGTKRMRVCTTCLKSGKIVKA